jgi:hypothetical protein
VWGQIVVADPGGVCSINDNTGAILTLTPTDIDAAGIGIDMSAATQNFTITAPITLGSSQTWTVASGRTLTINGAISSSSKTLTLSGSGTVSLGSIARTGWTGSATVVQSGVRLSATVNTTGSLGASSNTITVQSGGALSVTGGIAAATANWTLSGE